VIECGNVQGRKGKQRTEKSEFTWVTQGEAMKGKKAGARENAASDLCRPGLKAEWWEGKRNRKE
jgi:hypothetical protein